MAGAIIALLIIVLVVGLVFSAQLRTMVLKEGRTEARLRDPRTHTLAYAIPNGVDPVEVGVVLHRAGYTSVVGRVGAAECVRIECAPDERELVRSVLTHTHLVGADGAELDVHHPVFEDER